MCSGLLGLGRKRKAEVMREYAHVLRRLNSTPMRLFACSFFYVGLWCHTVQSCGVIPFKVAVSYRSKLWCWPPELQEYVDWLRIARGEARTVSGALGIRPASVAFLCTKRSCVVHMGSSFERMIID